MNYLKNMKHHENNKQRVNLQSGGPIPSSMLSYSRRISFLYALFIVDFRKFHILQDITYEKNKSGSVEEMLGLSVVLLKQFPFPAQSSSQCAHGKSFLKESIK